MGSGASVCVAQLGLFFFPVDPFCYNYKFCSFLYTINSYIHSFLIQNTSKSINIKLYRNFGPFSKHKHKFWVMNQTETELLLKINPFSWVWVRLLGISLYVHWWRLRCCSCCCCYSLYSELVVENWCCCCYCYWYRRRKPQTIYDEGRRERLSISPLRVRA